MENDAAADYLSLENNHFTNLGVGFNDQGRSYFGVQLLGATRADINANLFANVARQAIQNPVRAALMLQASSELRVAGNRLFGIGPERFINKTVGIAVGAAFRDLAVDDNTVARIADSAEKPEAAAWQAIIIASPPRDQADSAGVMTIAVPGVMVLPLNEGTLFLSAFRINLAARSRVSVSIRGNRLRGQATTEPLVEVDDVGACLFIENDCELTGKAEAVAQVRCEQVIASNNRVIGSREMTALALTTKQFTVLGNIASGPILVNGAPLPAPWDAFNIPDITA